MRRFLNALRRFAKTLAAIFKGQKVVNVITIDNCDGIEYVNIFPFFVPASMPSEDVPGKIGLAADDFLATEEGRKYWNDGAVTFNWGSVDIDLPDSFLNKYGISKGKSNIGDCILCDYEDEFALAPGSRVDEDCESADCRGTPVAVGDMVVSLDNNDYGKLVGEVIGIIKSGTPEHDEEAENGTDNIHVDFSKVPWSDKQMRAIEKRFSKLYGEPREFCELPLDDVIMAPEHLLRLETEITDVVDETLLKKAMALVAKYGKRITGGERE